MRQTFNTRIICSLAILAFAAAIAFSSCSYFETKKDSGRIKNLSSKFFYLNLSDDVKYTGDAKCRSCHFEICESFHSTGMGRSLYRPESGEPAEDFSEMNEVYNAASGYSYKITNEDGKIFVTEFRKDKQGNVKHELKKKVDYVIGSGANTRSYLFQEKGFVYEMPVTWFTAKKKWDMSPGFEKTNLRFSRGVNQECLNCHTGYPEFTEHSENKFAMPLPEGIGCERCHGPGELHVLRYTEKENSFGEIDGDVIDRTIVNPANLETEEKLSVCFQCHLQGEVRVFADGKKQTDFKPGMKLSDVKTVFVSDDNSKGSFKIASHAARMYLCDCFKGSSGKLTCITCHDPHFPAESFTREFYNGKCTGCHDTQKLSASGGNEIHKANADCISCHMKQGGVKDVQHVNFTDHWIRKEIKSEPRDEMLSPVVQAGPVKLKSFFAAEDSLAEMKLGIAYVKYFDSKQSLQEYLDEAIPLLERGLKKFPLHKEGLYYLGIAYLKKERYQDAVNALKKLSDMDKGNAAALFQLGNAYEKMKNTAAATVALNKSVSIFPENVKAYISLGNMYYASGKTTEAITAYMRALSVDSLNSRALNNLGDIYLYKLGKIPEAKKLLQSAIRNDPDLFIALNNLANALMLEGKPEEAEKIYLDVISRDEKNVMALGNLAVIYEDRKDIPLAKKMLGKVLAIDPGDTRARDMLEKLSK